MFDITVHQSDERTYFLAKMLDGLKCAAECHVFAPNIVLNQKALSDLPDGCVLIGGRADESGKALIDGRHIAYHNMMQDERFQAENARLTAEGTLAAMIDRTLDSIFALKSLIIGFGRTGAAVANLFAKLGLDFDVATTASVRPALAFCADTVPVSGGDLSRYDVIINTVPEKIINDSAVITIKTDAVYIELASKAGMNMEYARYLGVDAEMFPALPAKVSPIAAARAMKNYISGVI